MSYVEFDEGEEWEHTWKVAVSIVAAVTTPFSSVVCSTRSVTLTPNIVEQPREGTGNISHTRLGQQYENAPGPKLVAKRFAMKVNKLFATAGAGEVAAVKRASFSAMKRADCAYC